MISRELLIYPFLYSFKVSRFKSIFVLLVATCLTCTDFVAVVFLGILIASYTQNIIMNASDNPENIFEVGLKKIEDFNSSEIKILLTLTVFILVLKNVLNLLFIKDVNKFVGEIRRKYVNQLLSQYLANDYENSKRITSADVTYAVIDGTFSLFFGILISTFFLFADLFLALGLLLILFAVNVQMTVALLSSLLFFIFLLHKFTHHGIAFSSEQLRDTTINSRSKLNDAHNLFKEIRIHGTGSNIINQFEQDFKLGSNAQAQLSWFQQIPKYGYEIIGYLLSIIVVLVGQASSGRSSFALSSSLFLAVLTKLLPTSLRLQNHFSSIRQNFSGSMHTYTFSKSLILESRSQRDKRIDPVESDLGEDLVNLHFENINFTYRDSRTAILQDLTFKFKAGTITALIGNSGSGKSTLCDLALGLLEPTTGSVYFTKQSDGSKTNLSSVQKSYVAQQTILFNGTIKENLLYGIPDEYSDADLWKVLDLVNLSQEIKSFELKLYTNIGELGNSISGGQRQRLAIARELLTNPRLLILDEPTSSLDSVNQDEILNMISKLKSNTTIIIVAHRFETLRIADVILKLDLGKVNLVSLTEIEKINQALLKS